MGQIAHVTEHAAILGHGFLGGIVGIILSMRTDGGQDAIHHGQRQGVGQIATRTRHRRDVVIVMAVNMMVVVAVDAQVVVCFGGVAGEALGASPKTTEEAHDGDRREDTEGKTQKTEDRRAGKGIASWQSGVQSTGQITGVRSLTHSGDAAAVHLTLNDGKKKERRKKCRQPAQLHEPCSSLFYLLNASAQLPEPSLVSMILDQSQMRCAGKVLPSRNGLFHAAGTVFFVFFQPCLVQRAPQSLICSPPETQRHS